MWKVLTEMEERLSDEEEMGDMPAMMKSSGTCEWVESVRRRARHGASIHCRSMSALAL